MAAAAFADRVVLIDSGRIQVAGPLGELLPRLDPPSQWRNTKDGRA
jgi:hypothetical protein